MADAGTHAALMDATYRHQRLIYDATRRYFLLGRDHLIADLAPDPGARILEVACGTGRNLARISRRYPDARLFGLDISREMLRSADAKLGSRAELRQGDACTFDPDGLFGVAGFDRIVLSYGISMIPDWHGAMAHAARCLAPGGSLHVVDFGQQDGLPRWFAGALVSWLARFHVERRPDLEDVAKDVARGIGGRALYESLYRDYARYAVIARPA